MTLNEYQTLAQRTSNPALTQEEHLLNAMLGLAGETGECCDLVKKGLYQDGREIGYKLFDELSDVMWYIAEAAAAMGWHMEAIAEHNIDKLRKRYPDGFDAEHSLHREEYSHVPPES